LFVKKEFFCDVFIEMTMFYGPRKTTKASWTQKNFNKALKAVQDQNISIRKTKNNIPDK